MWQVKEILISLAQNVHQHEPGCHKYLVFEQRSSDADRPNMVLIEEWASEEALEEHHRQMYLKETHQKLEQENLVEKQEEIKVVDLVWGFERKEGGG